MTSQIGRRLLLWRAEYRTGGYVVLEQIPVTITEVRSVRGIWGGGEHEGWKAVARDGREFFCNWKSYPDDSLSPTYWWSHTDSLGNYVRLTDACQAYGLIPHSFPSGRKASPRGAKICKLHNRAMIDVGCWRCSLDK